MQSPANLMSRSTDGSPCLVDALTCLHAEVGDTALHPDHGAIDMGAGALHWPRLAGLLASG
jgi:hypothetical protein